MEERKQPAPPLAAASVSGNSKADSLAGYKWPPAGWPMFACVTRDRGFACRTGPTPRDDQDYLKYEVSVSPEGIYGLEILSGRIDAHGTQLTPAIGIRFTAREDWFDDNQDKAVLDMHIRGQRLIPERGAVLRVILAMTFIISRIDRGAAPNLKRVLKTYRLA
jgi:hypothetical protein